ncbi:MAG: DUF4861 family protein, partial [Lactococcus garvieae]
LLMTSCATQGMSVMVHNPAQFARSSETVELNWSQVNAKLNLQAGDSLVVLNADAKQIPYQWVTEGGDSPVKLIFQTQIAAGQTLRYQIKKGNPEVFASKVFARFVPERYDDFAWENDRVAFRTYGQALKPIDGPSNGIDAWNKRTNELIINKWYHAQEVEGKNYHSDYGTGCDYYTVGRSLGAGGAAPYVNDTLWLGENFKSYEVIDHGPIRTSFRLVYEGYNVQGSSVSEVKTITLDAGSQLSKMEVSYSNTNIMPVAAGIVKRADADSVWFSPDRAFLAYRDKNSPAHGTTFLALLSPSHFDELKVSCGHTIATMSVAPASKAEYYFGFGWDKWGFDSFEQWIKYLSEFNNRIKNPLKVTIK